MRFRPQDTLRHSKLSGADALERLMSSDEDELCPRDTYRCLCVSDLRGHKAVKREKLKRTAVVERRASLLPPLTVCKTAPHAEVARFNHLGIDSLLNVCGRRKM